MNGTAKSIFYDSERQKSVFQVPRDLIKAREILWGLIWREIKSRYRYAILGFLWAVIEPVTLMLLLLFVFSFVFKQRIPRSDASDVPIATQILCGLIFWQYFATSVSSATFSLVNHQNLVKKVFFPREVIPLTSVCYSIVNLSIGFLTLLCIHFIFQKNVSIHILWLFIIFPILFLFTAGLGFIFSAGHVHFRDIGNMVNVGLSFGFYASPVFYPLDWVRHACDNQTLPQWFYYVYLLNPMAGILTNLRECILFGKMPHLPFLIYSASISIICFIIGIYIFRRSAPTFSDYL